MALPILRCFHRIPLTMSLTRLILNERIILNRSCKARLASPSALVTAARPYSSDRDGLKQNQKVVIVGIPNPFIWLRTRIYYFLIKTYFDKEFSIEEFTEGAKQVSTAFFFYLLLLLLLLILAISCMAYVFFCKDSWSTCKQKTL